MITIEDLNERFIGFNDKMSLLSIVKKSDVETTSIVIDPRGVQHLAPGSNPSGVKNYLSTSRTALIRKIKDGMHHHIAFDIIIWADFGEWDRQGSVRDWIYSKNEIINQMVKEQIAYLEESISYPIYKYRLPWFYELQHFHERYIAVCPTLSPNYLKTRKSK